MVAIIVLFHGRAHWLYKQPVLEQTDFTVTTHPHFKTFHLFAKFVMDTRPHAFYRYTCTCWGNAHYMYLKMHIHPVHMYSVFNVYFALCQRELYNFLGFVFFFYQ